MNISDKQRNNIGHSILDAFLKNMDETYSADELIHAVYTGDTDVAELHEPYKRIGDNNAAHLIELLINNLCMELEDDATGIMPVLEKSLCYLQICFEQSIRISSNESIYDDVNGHNVPVETVRKFLQENANENN